LDHIGGNASIYNRFGFKTCSNKVTQFRRTPPTHTKQRCTVEENVAWLLCEYDELPLLNPPQMVYQTYVTSVVTWQTVDGEEMVVCSDTGTSLSLFRRLMYTQVMYGAKIFGFETLSSP
jgi:hypothetical protein